MRAYDATALCLAPQELYFPAVNPQKPPSQPHSQAPPQNLLPTPSSLFPFPNPALSCFFGPSPSCSFPLIPLSLLRRPPPPSPLLLSFDPPLPLAPPSHPSPSALRLPPPSASPCHFLAHRSFPSPCPSLALPAFFFLSDLANLHSPSPPPLSVLSNYGVSCLWPGCRV